METPTFIKNLKKQAEENPVLALGFAGVVLTGLSKIMNASTAQRNSLAWKKEVNRRANQNRR